MMDLDPRLIFYLEHREQIDEWLQLPKLEAEAADHFFAGDVSDAIEARTLPGEPRCFRRHEVLYRKTFLHLEHWKPEEVVEPLLGIGLEWKGGTGFFESIVGVWVDAGSDSGAFLRQRIDDGLERLRNDLNGTLDGVRISRPTQYWPLLAHVEPPSRFWEDLPGLSDQIAEHVASLWSHTWEVADQAAREWRYNA